MSIDLQRVMDELKAAALKFPMKAIAPMVLKEESTLRNELNEVSCGTGAAKVCIRTALRIIEASQRPDAPAGSRESGLAVVDLIEAGLGRCAFPLPKPGDSKKMPREMRLISKLTKEFGENIAHLADALEDDKWREAELETCIKENQDLLKACLEMNAYLEALKRELFEKGNG